MKPQQYTELTLARISAQMEEAKRSYQNIFVHLPDYQTQEDLSFFNDDKQLTLDGYKEALSQFAVCCARERWNVTSVVFTRELFDDWRSQNSVNGEISRRIQYMHFILGDANARNIFDASYGLSPFVLIGQTGNQFEVVAGSIEQTSNEDARQLAPDLVIPDTTLPLKEKAAEAWLSTMTIYQAITNRG